MVYTTRRIYRMDNRSNFNLYSLLILQIWTTLQTYFSEHNHEIDDGGDIHVTDTSPTMVFYL